MTNLFDILFGLLILLNIVDAVLTYKCITMKKGYEGNGIVRFAMKTFGLDVGLIVVKAAVLIYVFDTYWSATPSLEAIRHLSFACMVFAIVCIWNYRILRK